MTGKELLEALKKADTQTLSRQVTLRLDSPFQTGEGELQKVDLMGFSRTGVYSLVIVLSGRNDD